MIGQRSNKIDVNRFSFLGNIEMNGNDICVGIGFKSENFSCLKEMGGILYFFCFNPYRQIPETISKKRAVTQGISRKLFPGVFQILQFWGVTQGIFRKLFPGKFHEYLPMKKIFFPKNGAWLRGFSGNFFQANFLCTYSRKSINKYLLMTSWTKERSQLASFESLKYYFYLIGLSGSKQTTSLSLMHL